MPAILWPAGAWGRGTFAGYPISDRFLADGRRYTANTLSSATTKT